MSSQEKQRTTGDAVTMIGLDFGSTTSSAIVARAHVGRNSVTGRMSFGNPDIIYRSAPIFTPFEGDILDESALRMHIHTWLRESGITQKDLFCGGAIITGLATEKANAGCIAEIVKEHVGEVIIATASDPCLESWLAFMGSCSALSRCNNTRSIINLDIGGGTTNPAIGVNGNVLSTGCYFVGARHFQFEPGTYTITVISRYGQILLDHLGITKNTGDSLESSERDAILDFYLFILEAIVSGSGTVCHDSAGIAHTQIPLVPKELIIEPIITFSGGVGELIYGYAMNRYLPETTYYGDLGIDLARRILASPLLSEHIADMVPENMGRATVYGLAIHSTEVSGSTLFLPRQNILPLRDLPIVGRMPMDADTNTIAELIALVAKSAGGGAIHITAEPEQLQEEGILQGPPVENLERVKSLGQKICDVLQAEDGMAGKPLLLLVPHNCGKSLGNYATNWRKASAGLIVIDEILDRNAHFVNVGSIYNNIVPVSFYGVQ
ncbi:ethanolamine ammonia-lyase reactivating factor EutA [Desulfosediminicola flagellatus]|uniref:ethanolamine ammonia-lyase reactivating factor EutA n=1 Tax=Desulfosediminicola flagellatus TaxID=2569541 RepID=UPI0010ACC2A8|nr:ethanolamine ammonia-lyase reactivating factor EutA [Desulfosediminicola flagellatus]